MESPPETTCTPWSWPGTEQEGKQTPPAVQAYGHTLCQELGQRPERGGRLAARLRQDAPTSSRPPSSDSPYKIPSPPGSKARSHRWWPTGASGASPGALGASHCPGGEARRVRVWPWRVSPAPPVLSPPGTGVPADRAGGEPLGGAPGAVSGLWPLVSSIALRGADHGIRAALQCAAGGVGWDVWARAPYCGTLVCLGAGRADQLKGHPEGARPGDAGA
jgi:hypothetical protein